MSKIHEILKNELIGKTLVLYAHKHPQYNDAIEHYTWRVHDDDEREVRKIVNIDFEYGEYDITPHFIFEFDEPIFIQDDFSLEFISSYKLDFYVQSEFQIIHT